MAAEELVLGFRPQLQHLENLLAHKCPPAGEGGFAGISGPVAKIVRVGRPMNDPFNGVLLLALAGLTGN